MPPHSRPRLAWAGLALVAAFLLSPTACQQQVPADPVAQGRQLAGELGCMSCHSVNGAKAVGPTWKGLYGSQVSLADGATVVADDAYLAEKLANPGAKTVEGYSESIMVAALQPHRDTLANRQNVDAIIAYVKSLQ